MQFFMFVMLGAIIGGVVGGLFTGLFADKVGELTRLACVFVGIIIALLLQYVLNF